MTVKFLFTYKLSKVVKLRINDGVQGFLKDFPFISYELHDRDLEHPDPIAMN